MRKDAWRSAQGRLTFGRDLVAGSVIAIDTPGFRHQPWALHEVRERPEGHVRILVRPVGAQYDLAQHNRGLTMGPSAFVHVLPDHYLVCSKCGQLPPCAEEWTARISTASAERASRYEVEGVCPACQEPVTSRQSAHRFPENLYAPLGPPVTFHARNRCISSAVEYDRAVAAATGRQPTLSCDGSVVEHYTGERVCSSGSCPNLRARHRSWARCSVSGCALPECARLGAVWGGGDRVPFNPDLGDSRKDYDLAVSLGYTYVEAAHSGAVLPLTDYLLPPSPFTRIGSYVLIQELSLTPSGASRMHRDGITPVVRARLAKAP